jgi:SAM-dependent methyltransferase
MTDAMDAEFDTVALWTADVALALGPGHHLPAGCRGSGTPAALDWLLENLSLMRGESVLDCGAGVGGPAAYLSQNSGARPILVDPAAGACRAARRLFGLPSVRADAGALPFAQGRFGAAWCLGVLCTTDQQSAILKEAQRVLDRSGRLGLLVYVARDRDLGPQPEGNHFPRVGHLLELIEEAGFVSSAAAWLSDMPSAPAWWQDREDEVEAELRRAHGHTAAWRTSQKQSARLSDLITSGDVAGRLLVVRRAS